MSGRRPWRELLEETAEREAKVREVADRLRRQREERERRRLSGTPCA